VILNCLLDTKNENIMAIRVLVIDDSALMRKLLMEIINGEKDLEVVGSAPDAHAAREMIKTLNPDVVTLDVQMPKMDGIEFLEKLMRLRPTPVVMVSSFTEAGSETTLKALELGAVDFIGKPRGDTPNSMDEYAHELCEKLRAASSARLLRRPSTSARPPGSVAGASGLGATSSHPLHRVAPILHPSRLDVSRSYASNMVIYLGASTGGTEAIKDFLAGMPTNCPPILIVQHMPETFTASFAKRLDSLSAPRVIEAKGGEKIESGTVYIAPGHSHMLARKTAGGLQIELQQTPAVNRHRPAVDVLFESAAQVSGRNAVGVILTGMGKDGAQGMLKMRQAGAMTFGQDESSCVVYGMPKEAFNVGAVQEVVTLSEMAKKVLNAAAR
jgi:two-component system chemotaxis response regulator CheB